MRLRLLTLFLYTSSASLVGRRCFFVGLLLGYGGMGFAVDGVAEFFVEFVGEGEDLDKEDGGEVVFGIDPEEGAGGSVPEEFAYGSVVFFGGYGGTEADGEVYTETDLAF